MTCCAAAPRPRPTSCSWPSRRTAVRRRPRRRCCSRPRSHGCACGAAEGVLWCRVLRFQIPKQPWTRRKNALEHHYSHRRFPALPVVFCVTKTDVQDPAIVLHDLADAVRRLHASGEVAADFSREALAAVPVSALEYDPPPQPTTAQREKRWVRRHLAVKVSTSLTRLGMQWHLFPSTFCSRLPRRGGSRGRHDNLPALVAALRAAVHAVPATPVPADLDSRGEGGSGSFSWDLISQGS